MCTNFTTPPILQQIIMFQFFSFLYSIDCFCSATIFFVWRAKYTCVCLYISYFFGFSYTPSWPFFPTVNHINIADDWTGCAYKYRRWWHISNSSNVAYSKIHLGNDGTNEWITAAATWLVSRWTREKKKIGANERSKTCAKHIDLRTSWI